MREITALRNLALKKCSHLAAKVEEKLCLEELSVQKPYQTMPVKEA